MAMNVENAAPVGGGEQPPRGVAAEDVMANMAQLMGQRREQHMTEVRRFARERALQEAREALRNAVVDRLGNIDSANVGATVDEDGNPRKYDIKSRILPSGDVQELDAEEVRDLPLTKGNKLPGLERYGASGNREYTDVARERLEAGLNPMPRFVGATRKTGFAQVVEDIRNTIVDEDGDPTFWNGKIQLEKEDWGQYINPLYALLRDYKSQKTVSVASSGGDPNFNYARSGDSHIFVSPNASFDYYANFAVTVNLGTNSLDAWYLCKFPDEYQPEAEVSRNAKKFWDFGRIFDPHNLWGFEVTEASTATNQRMDALGIAQLLNDNMFAIRFRKYGKSGKGMQFKPYAKFGLFDAIYKLLPRLGRKDFNLPTANMIGDTIQMEGFGNRARVPIRTNAQNLEDSKASFKQTLDGVRSITFERILFISNAPEFIPDNVDFSIRQMADPTVANPSVEQMFTYSSNVTRNVFLILATLTRLQYGRTKRIEKLNKDRLNRYLNQDRNQVGLLKEILGANK
jgi:hypothetical protein